MLNLEKYGKNEIRRFKKVSMLKIFLSQFTSPLILILIAAAIISWAIGFLPGQESDIIDTILILMIVFASGIAGFFQEYKAEKSVEALQKMATPKAKVIRNGKEMEITAADIVPDDLILLESGDIVPADAKLVEAFNLDLDESILTGESHTVGKKTSEQIFMNTFVTVGSAKAVVTKTGMQTEVGKIASRLQEIEEGKTPFQVELSRFGRKICWLIIGLTILLAFIGFFKYELYQALLIAISLAVAAIPEGLPAVVVLALAFGAKSMVNKNALARKLSVVESIGAVDIICTDKTGTLTKNEMEVEKIFSNNKAFDADTADRKDIDLLLTCGALCNNSSIGYDQEGNKKYLGDQTEVAIRKVADRFGLVKEELEKDYKRVNEVSFTSKRKMMSVVCRHEKYFVYSKGAPEVLIEKCDRIYQNGRITKLTRGAKEKILDYNREFASRALRVLGFAFKETKKPEQGVEEKLVWIGLQAMIDPPRDEVRQALKDCRTAGIRTIIITGDNSLTAKAIADDIGLESKGILEGDDLDRISDEELETRLESGVNIFARTSPFHKFRILKILQKKNRVMMTGDGVNDALALKKADVGIAMGIRGTDVAKGASDMILLDDNFATIRDAIKEGRKIFDNIRKFVNYLFVCNFAEVGVIFSAALLLALKEPILLPVQILWINLLTDGIPAIALGIDPPRPDVMLRPPRRKEEPIINKSLWWIIGAVGTGKTIILLLTFFIVLPFGIDIARTTLFTGFILYEFLRIGVIRYQEELSFFANKWLILALIVSVLLQLMIIYTPLNIYFHLVPLGIFQWLILFGGLAIGWVASIAITKTIIRFVKD